MRWQPRPRAPALADHLRACSWRGHPRAARLRSHDVGGRLRLGRPLLTKASPPLNGGGLEWRRNCCGAEAVKLVPPRFPSSSPDGSANVDHVRSSRRTGIGFACYASARHEDPAARPARWGRRGEPPTQRLRGGIVSRKRTAVCFSHARSHRALIACNDAPDSMRSVSRATRSRFRRTVACTRAEFIARHRRSGGDTGCDGRGLHDYFRASAEALAGRRAGRPEHRVKSTREARTITPTTYA